MRRKRQLTPASIVTSLYRCLLGREPTAGEVLAFVAHLEGGGSVEQVVMSLFASPRYQRDYIYLPAFYELVAPDPLRSDVNRLYLWHIPKTGGTSLREMLRPHFTELEFCGNLPLGALYRMSSYRLRSFRVIAGHFGPMVPQLLPDVSLVTATLIRDPLDHIASFYVHWRDSGWPDHTATTLARRLSFAEWCRSEEVWVFWSNPQARGLASPRVPPDREQSQVSPEGEMVHLHDVELAEAAPPMLDSIDIVGTTDQLMVVYRECLKRLGITPEPVELLQANLGSGLGEEVSRSTRDWLLEHNTIDSALFDRAKIRGSKLQAVAESPLLGGASASPEDLKSLSGSPNVS